ncbi:hypothetical protein HPB49_000996 [Dermacentor silvarum]|uniref:Uncharacterized protein n=1 Tax=Dermacentor silvarum TaxID=543639 RepID=A0ACB8DM30_DERSI|nr:hypothetical protein HPB49_000996 [Dermacentor silvarum]
MVGPCFLRVARPQANDSAMQLLGESQEEDRRFIADLVLQRMQQYCRPPQQMGAAEPRAANTRPRRESQTSEKGEDPDDTMRNLRKTFAGVFGDM